MSEQDQVFTKCAWRLIPFMMLLYLVSFIDRTNAGFAAHTMNKDLGFSPIVFGFGAGIFFAGYGLFQVPSNVMLDRIGARRWIFCIMAIWGLLSALNALVQTPMSFYVVRFLLGAAEAGFAPGMFLYLTYWFPRGHLARLNAYFMLAIPLSFIVGGPLASLILEMDGLAGFHGWQWLFLMEGVPVILLAVAVLKVLPDRPARALWLTNAERQTIATSLEAEEPAGRPDLWSALLDLRVVALGIAYLAQSVSAYGIFLWLPQIVKAMGFSNTATGWVVALCFVAAIPAQLLGGRSSSKRGERIWHVALPWLLAAACFAVASLTQSHAIVLAALVIALAGNCAAYGTFFSLPSSFLRGRAAAGGLALVNSFSGIGGFVGPTLAGILLQGSGDYRTGFVADAIGYALGGLIIIAVGRALPRRAAIIRPAI